MKAHLLFRDRDFDAEAARPAHASDLVRDLDLETLFRTMGAGRDPLGAIARQAVLASVEATDRETILHRQAVLKDCLAHPELVEAIHAVAIEALEKKRSRWLGIVSSYPSSLLYSGVELLEMFFEVLVKLRAFAADHAREFESEGFRTLFTTIAAELSDDYFAVVRAHLRALKFPRGVLLTGRLGAGNLGGGYVLRAPPAGEKGRGWRRFFSRRQPGYAYHLDPRDEAGARALGEMRNRGINAVADAVAQASDHVLGFFELLRLELEFYLAAMNLHAELRRRGVPVCFPEPAPAGSRRLTFTDLRDPTLALRSAEAVVGNRGEADGKACVVITGANQGGKSTFLRSLGVAQVMLHAGLFVAADSFTGELCEKVFTHYRREEDARMDSGKFEEELVRMNEIVRQLTPHSLILFNESFASTNEREGSEVARQIVAALLESRVKVVYVTHLADFAQRCWREARPDALFLRAPREPDGRRTFQLAPGAPRDTSFGGDLYRKIFDGCPPVDPST